MHIMILEAEVENYLIWKVAVLGGKSYKFTCPGNRGVADQIVCMPDGTTHFIECKRPKGGRLAPLQAIFAGEMQMTNQRYALLNTKEAIDAYFAG